ncbi:MULTISPECIES: DUF3800 domain-containing protein [Duganella]|uniref:DUF3800 domain-containing protein n=2 Tax=Duganella TaxID=75654 RepID=A0A845GRR0_9BURK|nr:MULTISPECIES: DUF3800 domain-containing protein [Duganella]MYM80786.1 DUF3800 domain-containing protein [Duganella lactea]MYM96110.1 DUF3800 domain-containing protein [Duganella vulcania]
MHLLYLDESGHSHDPNSQFFVLAGFSVFERQTHWLESQITPVAERFSKSNPSAIEFHGAPMRSGKDEWEGVAPADRVQAVVDILDLLSDRQLQLRVYVSVIEKSLFAPEAILQQSFEDIASCFDQYLQSLYRRKNDPQRGLVIFDKSNYEQKLQALSQVFKHQGNANGKVRNFAEVPLFLDSKASRLIQLADLIAYWTFRYFQSGDDRGYKMIEPYFCRFAGANGYMPRITAATEQRLQTLAAQKYPFPAPTARTSTTTSPTTTVISTTATATVTQIQIEVPGT